MGDGLVFGGLGGDEAGEVVVVGKGDITETLGDRFDLVDVTALGRSGEVGDETA